MIDIARLGGVTGLTIGAFKLAALIAVSTPVGMMVGAAAVIGIVAADHFFFEEDHKKDELERRHAELRARVVGRAYDMFGLEEHCTDRELRQAWRQASLKYHPDKAGNREDFDEDVIKAVNSAYALLRVVRKEDD